jgi:hypothetical protein
MLMSDANTNTLYSWAFDYPEPESIPASLEKDREKLIDIIDMIESCIGNGKEKLLLLLLIIISRIRILNYTIKTGYKIVDS